MVQQIENKYIKYNPSEILPTEFRHPVFILGLMRSGTTLLLNILSEHPQLLKIGVELNSIWTKIGGACCQGECHYKTAKDVKPEYVVNMTNYFKENIVQYQKGRQGWKRFLFSIKFGSGGIRKDWDQIIPINKSPHLSNKSLYLHEMFPESKFVHIIRSVHSHSYSMKRHFEKDFEQRKFVNYLPEDGKNCWTRMHQDDLDNKDQSRLFPSNFSLIPEAWINMNYQAIKDLEECGSEDYRIFSYEDLVNKPEKVLPEIFEFLKLDAKHEKQISKIVGRQRKSFNTHTKDPMNDWKTKLTLEEQQDIQQIINENSEKYDYILKSC